jgi:hypothetical protein
MHLKGVCKHRTHDESSCRPDRCDDLSACALKLLLRLLNVLIGTLSRETYQDYRLQTIASTTTSGICKVFPVPRCCNSSVCSCVFRCVVNRTVDAADYYRYVYQLYMALSSISLHTGSSEQQ